MFNGRWERLFGIRAFKSSESGGDYPPSDLSPAWGRGKIALSTFVNCLERPMEAAFLFLGRFYESFDAIA